MKLLYFFWILFGSLNLAAAQEPLLGNWVGVITQDEGGYRSEYYFELYLKKENKLITGRSYVQVDDIYAEMALSGFAVSEKVFHFTESKVVYARKLPNLEWCLKGGALKLERSSQGWELRGRWEGTSAGGELYPWGDHPEKGGAPGYNQLIIYETNSLFYILLGCLSACSTAPEQKTASSAPSEEAASAPSAVYTARDTALLPPAIRRQKQIWQEAFAGMNAQALQACYWEKGGLLLSREFSQDPEEITRDFIKIRSMLGAIRYQDVFSVVPHGEDHYFEMGFCRVVSDDGAFPYLYVNAWKRTEDQWLIEMQALEEQKGQGPDLEEIDRARELWQEQSNARDHEKLVAASYSPDGYYFNQGRIHQGTAAISEVYSYMSGPDWQITLRPISVLPASPEVVLELGQYQSGGTGHYLIIWEKQDEGEWRVLLDFNF